MSKREAIPKIHLCGMTMAPRLSLIHIWGDTAEIFKNPKHDMTKQLLGYEVMKK